MHVESFSSGLNFMIVLESFSLWKTNRQKWFSYVVFLLIHKWR